MLRMLVQVIFIAAVGFAAWWWYSLVLPAVIATIFAVLIAGVAIFGMLSPNSGGFKSSTLGGVVIASWPAGVLIIEALAGWVGVPVSSAVAQAGAIIVAMLVGQASFTVAEKRDRARDLACASVGFIGLYSIISAVLSGDRVAISIACLGVAGGLFMARQQLIIPPKQDSLLVWAAGAATASFAINAMAAVVL